MLLHQCSKSKSWVFEEKRQANWCSFFIHSRCSLRMKKNLNRALTFFDERTGRLMVQMPGCFVYRAKCMGPLFSSAQWLRFLNFWRLEQLLSIRWFPQELITFQLLMVKRNEWYLRIFLGSRAAILYCFFPLVCWSLSYSRVFGLYWQNKKHSIAS